MIRIGICDDDAVMSKRMELILTCFYWILRCRRWMRCYRQQ